MKTKLIQTTLLLLAAILPLAAAAEKLVLGGPAPPLATGKFVQGEKVTEFEKGKVYIVGFWAIWCGPRLSMIPQMNAWQKKFEHKGLIVIGQNAGDQNEKSGPTIHRKNGRPNDLPRGTRRHVQR